MKLLNMLSIITLFLLIIPINSYATTYVYLIGGDGTVIKINTDTNTIVTTTTLTNTTYVQSGDTSVIGEPINKRLFVEVGRLSSWIQVYDLSTLKFIKNLDIRTSEPDMYMFTSPDGNYLFIRWWNAALNKNQGDWEYDQYNVKTLTKIQSLPNFLFSNENMYSSDGSKIYVIRGGSVNEVDIYNASTFTSEGYIDLNPIFNKFTNVGHSINDYKNGELLIAANLASSFTVTPHLIFYTYNLVTATSSPVLDVGGVRVKCKLSLDLSRYYCDEVQIASTNYGHSHRYVTTGNLYFYNSSNRQQLGTVSLPAGFDPSPAIRPQGDYFYYYYYKGPSLIVVDATHYKILKTIPIPGGYMGAVFDEE